MSLSKQCEKISIELKDIRISFTGRPEQAVLAHFQSLGYVGSSLEGIAFLTVIKALVLDKLAEFNPFNDRSDACTRYLEAQFNILSDKIDEIISSINHMDKDKFLNNFTEIINQPFIKTEYPGLSNEFASAVFDAVDIDIFIKLATKISEDPYTLRRGWPDLTIIKGTDLQFIEVKTTDKLNKNQLKTIPILREILPFQFAVYKIKQ